MDKFEYELKVEQIEKLVTREDYSTAKKIADSMEWKKEKDPKLLSHVAELYAQAGDIDKALKIYNYAYNASSRGLLILERMTELAIIFGQLDLAEELVEEYRGAGAYEPDYYMFKYQITEGRGEDYVKRIPYLEKYCESELDEDAMYQLAWLYDRAGMTDKCVKMCDFIIDYFCFGENVDHAIALKLNHAKLTEHQERRVTNADEYKQSYESYLKSQSDEEKREKSERKAEEQIRQDAIMEQQENDLGKQVSEIVEQNEREKQEINLKELVAEEEAMARISFPTAASLVPEKSKEEPVKEEPVEEEPVEEEPVEEESVEELEAETEEEPIEESIKEPVEESIEEPVEEPVEELPEELTEENTEEPTEELAEENAEELTEENTEELTEESVEEPVDESIEEPEEEQAENPEQKDDMEKSIEEALAGEIEAILSESVTEKKNSSPDEVIDALMKEIEAVDLTDETADTLETERIELEDIDELIEEIEEIESEAEAKHEEETAEGEEKSEEGDGAAKEAAGGPAIEILEEPAEEILEEQLTESLAEADKETGEETADISVEESVEEAAKGLAEETVPDTEVEEIALEETETVVEELLENQTETAVEEIPEDQTETVAEENTEEPIVESRKPIKRDLDISALDIVVPEGSFKVACSDMEMGVKYAIELVRLVPPEERAEHVARVSASRMNKGKFSSVEQQLDRDILLITNAGQLTNTSLDNIYAWMKRSMENKVIFVDDADSLMELEKRRPKLMKRITGDYAYEKKDTAQWLDIVDSYADENNCVLADDAYHLFEEYLNDKEEKNDVVLGITLKEAVQDALHMASKISVRNLISSLTDTKYDEEGLLILRDRHFL